jgi:hypothetical protein
MTEDERERNVADLYFPKLTQDLSSLAGNGILNVLKVLMVQGSRCEGQTWA